MVCLTQIAEMSASEIKKVHALEKELGVVLIAYKPLEFADLSTAQIKELQKVEKDIGATVVAYR
jgi:diketogulonate reductase-like aldo/keto reductase